MSGLEKLFGSQRAITILVVSVVFAIVFPAYFSYMATNSDAIGGGSSGAKGMWQVDFIQDNITSDETMNLGNNEQYRKDVLDYFAIYSKVLNFIKSKMKGEFSLAKQFRELFNVYRYMKKNEDRFGMEIHMKDLMKIAKA